LKAIGFYGRFPENSMISTIGDTQEWRTAGRGERLPIGGGRNSRANSLKNGQEKKTRKEKTLTKKGHSDYYVFNLIKEDAARGGAASGKTKASRKGKGAFSFLGS